MNLGKLLKSLRVDRQLTQETLSKGITTRTTLASIENRNKTISFDLLMKLLDRLNVRVEEFHFLLNEGLQSEKQTFYLEAYSNYYSKGYLNKDLEKKILKKYQETNDFFFIALYTQMLGSQLRKSGSLPPKDEANLEKNIDLIKTHLNKVNTWTHMELALFINCLYIFDTSYINAVYKRTVKKLVFRKKLRIYEDDIIIFLLNCIDLFLERNQTNLVEYYLKELDTHITRENQLNEKLLSHFYHAIIDIQKGNLEAVDRIESLLNSLDILGETRRIQSLKKDLKKDLKKYTNISL